MSPSRPLRVVVFAHHELGHAGLRALLARREHVLAAVLRPNHALEGRFPDRLVPLCAREAIDVVTPEAAAALAPDLVADFGYGLPRPPAGARGALVLGPRVLELRGALARGADAVEVALTHGPAGVIARDALPVGAEDDAFTLVHRVAAAAHELVHAVLPGLRRGDLPALAPDAAAPAPFRAEEARLDPAGGAGAAHRVVRACTEPFEGAWFEEAGGRRVTVWEAHPAGSDEGLDPRRVLRCADGVLRLDRVAR